MKIAKGGLGTGGEFGLAGVGGAGGRASRRWLLWGIPRISAYLCGNAPLSGSPLLLRGKKGEVISLQVVNKAVNNFFQVF
jgi:hypothetical protein